MNLPSLYRRWAGPLDVHLSVLVILLLTATAVPLVWVSYDRGKDVGVAAARQRMELLTERTADRYGIVFDNVEPFVTMAAVSETFATSPAVALDRKIATFIAALTNSAYLDGMYAAYPDGTFVHVVNLDNNTAWRTAVRAPENASFAARVILEDASGNRNSVWRFLDGSGVEISRTQPVGYGFDPRTRPWYKLASAVPGTISIGPYITATTRALALTVARGHHDDARIVVGSDILLTTIAQFLATEKVSPGSIAYVLDAFGKLIIHSEPETMRQLLAAPPEGVVAANVTIDDRVFDAAQAAMSSASKAGRDNLQFTVNGQPYIGSATTMKVSPSLDGNTLLIAAPLSDFTAESQRQLRQGLLYSIGLLALGIVATVLVAKLITRSLSALTVEAARLGDLDVGQPSFPHSHIAEINSLARALAVARDAITSFALYVPRELVRKIVASNSVATGAAVRDEISVLFTDIRDFTTICERTSPEEVVAMLSAYFDEINGSVEANHGTIIQFLGDSVCAMWNAPVADPDHPVHACRGALAIAATVADFNARQRSAGKAELFTRIGLHTGPAVVGNVGAASRLQYTAMGDTMNVASRLEGINKEFGTTIMVSRAIVDRCPGAFVFRPLGTTHVKGRAGGVEIFELVGPAGSGPA